MNHKSMKVWVILVVVAMMMVGNIHARLLSKNEMNSVLGTGCCSGTEVSNSCSGSGGPCNFCNCSGSYTKASGSLDKCTPSDTPGKDCEDVEGVTCTETVFCNPGQVFPNSRCAIYVGCPNQEGESCIKCAPTSVPNPNVTQTCD
jgi:hypothetical protein